MKGKLIKTDVNYILEDDKGIVVASTSLKKEGLSLSLKNCQAIERGYDLEQEMCKLVDKKAQQSNTIDLNAYGQGCLDAFQKALEILGDKKFSEEDLRLAMHFGKFGESNNQTTTIGFIQSLQQTEWDVTFNPEEKDSEGCLILKRI